jgi:hypothetical protein
VITLFSNYFQVFQFIVEKLGGAFGSSDLKAVLDNALDKKVLQFAKIIEKLSKLELSSQGHKMRFQVDLA